MFKRIRKRIIRVKNDNSNQKTIKKKKNRKVEAGRKLKAIITKPLTLQLVTGENALPRGGG